MTDSTMCGLNQLRLVKITLAVPLLLAGVATEDWIGISCNQCSSATAGIVLLKVVVGGHPFLPCFRRLLVYHLLVIVSGWTSLHCMWISEFHTNKYVSSYVTGMTTHTI